MNEAAELLPEGLTWALNQSKFSSPAPVAIATRKIKAKTLFGPYQMKVSGKSGVKIRDSAGKWIKLLSSNTTSEKSKSNCFVFRLDESIHLLTTKDVMPSQPLVVLVSENQSKKAKNLTKGSKAPKASLDAEEIETDANADSKLAANENSETSADVSGAERESKSPRRKSKLRIKLADRLTCCICEKKFAKNEREEHMRNEHMVGDNFCCTSCDYSTNTSISLRLHFCRLHIRKPINRAKRTKCEFCGGRRLQLEKHLEKCAKRSLIPDVRCCLCDELFLTNARLRAHYELLHKFGDSYRCPKCDYSQRTFCRVRNHFLAIHSSENNYGCEECGKSFPTNPKLNRHVLMVHKQLHKKCENCGWGFKKQENLIAHLKKCTDDSKKRFPCDMCDQKFVNTRLRGFHKRTVHFGEELFVCQLCKRTFVSQEVMEKHIQNRHDQSRAVQEWPCVECEKTFPTKAGLLRHDSDVHGLELPVKCKYCDKRFLDQYNELTMHVKKCHGNYGLKSLSD